LYKIVEEEIDIDEKLKGVPNIWYALQQRGDSTHEEWANQIMVLMGDHLIEGPLCENGEKYLEDYLHKVLCIVGGIDRLHSHQADQLCALYCDSQRQDLVTLNSCTCNSGLGTADIGCGKQVSQRAKANLDNFDPSSSLVSYIDNGSCGPRGDDAQADLSQCSNGWIQGKHVPLNNYQVVATIDGCDYYTYTIYQCEEAYVKLNDGDKCKSGRITDEGTCKKAADFLDLKYAHTWHGPHDVVGCIHANDGRDLVYFNTALEATGSNKKYAEICSHNGDGVSKFDPSSSLVSYIDNRSCGPRGDDAKADLSQCSNGYIKVEHVPLNNYQVVATIDGCDYYAYTIYQCEGK